MSLDINTSIAFLKERVDKTLSVQTEIAPIWIWPLKSLKEWQNDSIQLDKSQEETVAAKAISASTRMSSSRGLLDARLELIHSQTKLVVGVMRVRAERDPGLRDVVDALSARGDSRRSIEDEASALISAWKEEFAGPAFVPAPKITHDAFRELIYGVAANGKKQGIPSLRALKQDHSDKLTVERREVGRVSALLNRVERDAVDWYAEATSVFEEGTEIGELLRALIPTTGRPAAEPRSNGQTPIPARAAQVAPHEE
ncbi:MAG: hypothetical protein JWL59_3216 [Chthoniobacteraceae bacterium]|nr:hypothetical protein [Chthoniobacteraceae bacterium]